MKRVMIVGQPGGGKSWLARAIGARTGLPVHHMDMIHWMPGWVERPQPQKIDMARAVEDSDAWVFEGGLSSTYYSRLARADTLIVLDMPFLLRCWRVFTRTLRDYGRSRADLPPDCPEQFSAEFWHFIWTTRNTNRARMYALIDKADRQTTVHVLKSRRDVARFLKTLDAAQTSGQESAHAALSH